MATGTIRTLRDRGFGFIEPDGDSGSGELFFHHSAVADRGFEMLQVGQRVSFDVTPDPRDPGRQRAINVVPEDVGVASLSPTGWTAQEGPEQSGPSCFAFYPPQSAQLAQMNPLCTAQQTRPGAHAFGSWKSHSHPSPLQRAESLPLLLHLPAQRPLARQGIPSQHPAWPGDACQ